MLILKDGPIQQNPFTREMISPEMERLFRYVMAMEEYNPAHIDNLAEVLDFGLSDDDLARICDMPAGPEISDPPTPMLRYSCSLRESICDQLAEIDMALDVALADGTSLFCGWLVELLGEDTVREEEFAHKKKRK